MRALLRWLLGGVGLFVLAGSYFIWNNNRNVPAPVEGQLGAAREKGIQWLTNNRQKILDTYNPMLWRMVQQAAEISGDERLQALFASYRQRYLDTNRSSIWHPLFYPKTWVPVRFQDIARLPDYNQHFIYAITCDRDLAAVPEIAAQNEQQFCGRQPLRPACVTHQMMGMLLLKRSGCGDAQRLDETIEALQQRIHKQLTWDPRVVDVYMQRVLMLVESGAGDSVRPVWLKHLLDAQQPDGGWSPFMPLVPLGKHRYIGIARLPAIRAPRSEFHMTAQGVLLFTLLSHPQQK